jgi:hypothetical protein
MPESKHRRHGKVRKREYQTHAPEKKPAPSPEWVPRVGVGLLVAGLIVIIVGYLPVVIENVTGGLPVLGSNWSLVGGFILLIAGFAFLTRWR